MPPVTEPDDRSDPPKPPSALKSAIAKMRGMNRRYVGYFIAGGIALDVVIVAGGLWWLGVFDAGSSSAAVQKSLNACLRGADNQSGVVMIDTCLDTVTKATDDPENRRDPAYIEMADQALRHVQVVCRVVLSRDALERCTGVPVIEGIVPALAVRTRVDALLRLGDYPRLREEGARLIRYGDGFGYLARGLARHNIEDFAAAAADYREAIKHFPDDPVLLDNLARAEVAAPPS
jgi:hypothetical protein